VVVLPFVRSQQLRHTRTLALLDALSRIQDTSTEVAEDEITQTVYGVASVRLLHPGLAAGASPHSVCLRKFLELWVVFLRVVVLLDLHSHKRHFPPRVAAHRLGMGTQLPVNLRKDRVLQAFAAVFESLKAVDFHFLHAVTCGRGIQTQDFRDQRRLVLAKHET